MSKKKKVILRSNQIKFLRGLGHNLSANVQIGKEGISSNVLKAAEQELLHHELVKIRIGNNSGVDKNEAVLTLTETTGSDLVQLIGKTIILFKANKKLPANKRISLPR